MKTVVATMYSDEYAEIAGITLPVFQKYCERHNYTLHLIRLESPNYAFRKHEVIRNLLYANYGVVFYLDVDAVITNLSVPIESFMDVTHDFYICRDATELNGGALIFKNSTWARAFNEYILCHKDDSRYENEQNVMNVACYDDGWKDKIKIFDDQCFNSYRYELYPECVDRIGRKDLGDWVQGESFVLHTPGLGLEKRKEILKTTKITE